MAPPIPAPGFVKKVLRRPAGRLQALLGGHPRPPAICPPPPVWGPLTTAFPAASLSPASHEGRKQMEGRDCQTSPTPAPPRLWAGPVLPQAFLSAKRLGLGWKECVLESERRPAVW